MISEVMKENISKELCRIEEDCIYSAKSHFNASDRWSSYHYWLGVPSIVLSIVAGATVPTEASWVATIASIGAAVLTSLITFLKPSEAAAQHKSSGDQYLGLRNDARIFREVSLTIVGTDAEAFESLKELTARRTELNGLSRQPSRKDFEIARKGIEEGESDHAVDRDQVGKH
jgi:hypothetical protein